MYYFRNEKVPVIGCGIKIVKVRPLSESFIHLALGIRIQAQARVIFCRQRVIQTVSEWRVFGMTLSLGNDSVRTLTTFFLTAEMRHVSFQK